MGFHRKLGLSTASAQSFALFSLRPGAWFWLAAGTDECVRRYVIGGVIGGVILMGNGFRFSFAYN